MDEEPFYRPYVDRQTGRTVMLTDAQFAADEDRYRRIAPGERVHPPANPLGETVLSGEETDRD